MKIERYPLAWPIGQPRATGRRAAVFKVDLRQAFDDLMRELALLGALDVVVSSNIATRSDGRPYADAEEPKDPGIAVYFDRRLNMGGEYQRRPFVIACDTYQRARWNMRAIGVTVEALRAIQRHGASSMLEQAFTGFAALPPASVERPWWEVLGVPENAPPDEIQRVYRTLAAFNHPDRGGDSKTMAEINRAYALATGKA